MFSTTNKNTNRMDMKDENDYNSDEETEESLYSDAGEEDEEDDDSDGYESEDIDHVEMDINDLVLDRLAKEHDSTKLGVKRHLQLIIEMIQRVNQDVEKNPESYKSYTEEFSLDDIEEGKAENIKGLPNKTKAKVFKSAISKNIMDTFTKDNYEETAAIPFVRLDSPEPPDVFSCELVDKNDKVATYLDCYKDMYGMHQGSTLDKRCLPITQHDSPSVLNSTIVTEDGSEGDFLSDATVDDTDSITHPDDSGMTTEEETDTDSDIEFIDLVSNVGDTDYLNHSISVMEEHNNNNNNNNNNEKQKDYISSITSTNEKSIIIDHKNSEFDSGIDLTDLWDESNTDGLTDNISVCNNDKNNVTSDSLAPPICFFKRSICPEKQKQKCEEIEKVTMTILPPYIPKTPTVSPIISIKRLEQEACNLNITPTISIKRLEDEAYNPSPPPPPLKPKQQPSPQFSKSSIWTKTVNDEQKIIKCSTTINNSSKKIKEKGIFTSFEKEKEDVKEKIKQSSEIGSIHPNESNTKTKQDDLVKPKFSSNSIWSTASKNNNNNQDSSSSVSNNQSFQSKPQFSKSFIWTGRKRAFQSKPQFSNSFIWTGRKGAPIQWGSKTKKPSIWDTNVGTKKTSSRINWGFTNWGFPNEPQQGTKKTCSRINWGFPNEPQQ